MNIDTEEKQYIFGISRISGVGYRRFIDIMDFFKSAKSFWMSSSIELEELFGQLIGAKIYQNRSEVDIKRDLKILENLNISIATLGDDKYPKLLSEISDPPVCLYYNSNADLSIINKSITIVGSRKNSHYGNEILEKVIPQLIKNGFAITSGMAFGIDSLSHRIALENNGNTVAVLGSSVDNPTPNSNSGLYERIVRKNNIIFSEYFPSKAILPANFARRNRILAGLSQSTIVIEASERSGALITAHLAFDYNRNVFAFPGDINHSLSKGCNHLIRIQKATLVTSAEQILEELGEKIYTKSLISSSVKLEPLETKIYDYLVANNGANIDSIKKNIDTSISELLASLMTLEIKKLVRVDEKGNYILS